MTELEQYKAALNWALSRDTGLSSNQLVATYFKVDARPYAPGDAGDRGRCIRAIEKMPFLLGALKKLESEDPNWMAAGTLIRKEMGCLK
jgi:hypothetical protein